MTTPLPATIVTGYLGAGKTTLVNRLLRDARGKRLMVLVNDFGEIAIDEELIVSRTGDTIALANGCMCCSIGGDLYDAIDRILSRSPLPDHLVIETSGVADPAKIDAIARAEPALAAHGIATVVDVLNLKSLLADPLLADTVERQICAADLIVLAKTDLCRPEAAEAAVAVLREQAPGTAILLTSGGAVPPDLLMENLRAQRDSGTAPVLPPHGAQEEHDHEGKHAGSYRTWSYSGEAAVARDALETFLGRSDLGIYRLKGFVHLAGGGQVEVHRAGSFSSVTPLGDHVPGQTRLVAIGPTGRFHSERIAAKWDELVRVSGGGKAA